MTQTEKESGGGRLELVAEGEWAGWQHWMPGDPFEDHVGPFYMRHDQDGVVCGFMPTAKNCNGWGNVHGGALMSFADYALFMIPAQSGQVIHGVTVTMSCEFVSGAKRDVPLYARGELVKAGRSLVFVRGTITSDNATVLTFSGTIKRAG